MAIRIVPVVEGIGERSAVPELLRRILYERMGLYDHLVGTAVCAKGEGNLTSRIETYVRYALESTPDAIIVIRDSDECCAWELASTLAARCLALNTQTPIAVVCAVRKYENWFLASYDSVKGESSPNRSLPRPDTGFAGKSESMANAKAWLTQNMPRGRPYKETSHQTPLTNRIDIDVALTNSRSFRRLYHAVEELVQAIASGTVMVSPTA